MFKILCKYNINTNVTINYAHCTANFLNEDDTIKIIILKTRIALLIEKLMKHETFYKNCIYFRDITKSNRIEDLLFFDIDIGDKVRGKFYNILNDCKMQKSIGYVSISTESYIVRIFEFEKNFLTNFQYKNSW